jgi:hypothetical protein
MPFPAMKVSKWCREAAAISRLTPGSRTDGGAIAMSTGIATGRSSVIGRPSM